VLTGGSLLACNRRFFPTQLTDCRAFSFCFFIRILNHIPLHLRFGMSGIFCNITKVVLYNVTVELLRGIATPARIYSILDVLMMFVGHGMGCLIVFGWPDQYCTNFMNNTPVGIIGMIIGTSLTAYLTTVHFNDRMIDWIKTDFTILPVREDGDVYTSLVVLTVCNVWTFVAANVVNRPKYLKAFKDRLV
jgi:hypothetical protein